MVNYAGRCGWLESAVRTAVRELRIVETQSFRSQFMAKRIVEIADELEQQVKLGKEYGERPETFPKASANGEEK